MTDYVALAEERVHEALGALARLEHGDPALKRWQQEYADAQLALILCRERWLGISPEKQPTDDGPVPSSWTS